MHVERNREDKEIKTERLFPLVKCSHLDVRMENAGHLLEYYFKDEVVSAFTRLVWIADICKLVRDRSAIGVVRSRSRIAKGGGKPGNSVLAHCLF